MQRPLVIDLGIYTSIAARLAEDTPVAYFADERNAFPVSRESAPATGIKNIERIEDPIRFMLDGKASHVIIPDLYLSDYGALAKELGIPTFSAGTAEEIETDRWKLMEFLDQNGLPVIHTDEIQGIDALAKYLEKPANADKYIKVSTFRGDLESFHHVKYSSTLPWLNDLKHRLGAWGSQIRFIAQDPIEADIEIGIDTYVRDGRFVTPTLVGVEHKDAAYFGMVFKEIPRMFDPVVRALGPYFKQRGYNLFFSNEMRITDDGTIYFTDATCRLPWPPSSSMMRAAENFSDVVLNNAAPDYGSVKYVCELVMVSDWLMDRTNWLQVSYPPKLKQNYSFHRFCEIDGKTWIIPHDPVFTEFGSALGWGSTADEAKAMCREAAENLEGYRVSYDDRALDEAEDGMQRFMEINR